MTNTKKSSSALDKQIIELYNDKDMSTYEIAEKLNTYPNKIRRTLLKYGYDLKSKSEAQKNALDKGRVNHPTEGRERSVEERVNISAGVAKHWEHLSDDERDERAKAAKDRWDNMPVEKRERICRLATEAIRKAGKEGSKLEKYVVKKLEGHGYRVDAHNKTLIPTEKLEIDLYIPALRTIIEIDGPSHFLPIWGEEKLQKQTKADLHKSGVILSRGYVIIRVRAIKTPNLKTKEGLVANLLAILNNIEKEFPPKTKRFIEVEL